MYASCVYMYMKSFFFVKFFPQIAPFLKLVFFPSQIHFQGKQFINGVKSFRDIFFFIILGHLLGYKGENWSLLKKKRKNNKKKSKSLMVNK